jgi:hypothetical protein
MIDRIFDAMERTVNVKAQIGSLGISVKRLKKKILNQETLIQPIINN